jgi:hypothetical protein
MVMVNYPVEAMQFAPEAVKTFWLQTSPDTKHAEAEAMFEAKYGYEPEYCVFVLSSHQVLVGPKRKEEE